MVHLSFGDWMLDGDVDGGGDGADDDHDVTLMDCQINLSDLHFLRNYNGYRSNALTVGFEFPSQAKT